MVEKNESDSDTISIGSISSLSFSSIGSKDIKKLKENPKIKELIDDNAKFNNFDWQTYRDNYSDLKFIKTKRDAWTHWRNHGQLENRTDKLINPNLNEKFDWKTYVSKYEDLKHIDNKKTAWEHWINHGVKEGRSFHKEDSYKKNKEYENFSWKIYINNYTDLVHLNTKEKAWEHWINHGKKEGRTIPNQTDEEYNNFLWETYIDNYKDLEYIDNKEDAWKHWINHGKKEGRTIGISERSNNNSTKEWEGETQEEEYDEDNPKQKRINNEKDKELENDLLGNEIEEKEENQTCRVIFKPYYNQYGTHLFGWEGTINNFIDNFNNQDIYKFNVFFDEWLEKLLLWGNKKENNKYKKIITTYNYPVISFIHNPPVELWNNTISQKKIKSETLLHDNYQLNNYLFYKLDKQPWNKNIIYLYVLSNYHKNYLYHKFPRYKDKLVSIYHPISLECKKKELFSFTKFLETKNIFHIGWWLRNFSSFEKLILPNNFKKNILIKNDFKHNNWETIFSSSFKTNINVIEHLTNEEYIKLFRNSCIFLDIIDGIANNLVLECIKYNTPIMVKRLPSLIEYLGDEYPLFFTNLQELNQFIKEEETFLELVKKANTYLSKMDKNHISLANFNKKINYDLSKLEKKTNETRLVWICVLKQEYLFNLNTYLENFSNQTIFQEIKLLLFVDDTIELINENISKIYETNNKEIIIYKKNDLWIELNKFIKYTSTDYFIMTEICDIYDKSFSKKMVTYLDKNPTCDLGITTFIKKNNSETITQTLPKNTLYFTKINKEIGRITWRKNINTKLELEIDENYLENCLNNNLNMKSISSKPLYFIN